LPYLIAALIEGEQIEVHIEYLKVIFFVKIMMAPRINKKTYNYKVPDGCRKIQVKFLDGETITGDTTGYSPDRLGFYIVPQTIKEIMNRYLL
jgi:hypothetical protein